MAFSKLVPPENGNMGVRLFSISTKKRSCAEYMALTKRSIQAAQTKERIRTVALSLMKEHSIEEISVNDICKKAKVGIGTFYHYYKTRDDIILEVFEEMDIYFTTLFQDKAAEQMTPYEYVLQHCVCYAKFICNTGVDFTRKVYSLQSKTILSKSRPIYTTLQLYLDNKQQKGLIHSKLDIHEFCSLIMIGIRGVSYDWCLHEGQYDLINKTVWYMENLLTGYRPLLRKPAPA